MTRYILRRLLIAVPVLWGIVTLTFIMSEIMPGDYVDALVPPNLRLQMGVDSAQLQRLRESYGLDKPVIFRYGIWLRELVLHGNLGYSFITGQPALQRDGPGVARNTATVYCYDPLFPRRRYHAGHHFSHQAVFGARSFSHFAGLRLDIHARFCIVPSLPSTCFR